jgi:protein-disulfide isomerase
MTNLVIWSFSHLVIRNHLVVRRVAAIVCVFAALSFSIAAQQPQAPQLVITSAVPDPSGQTLTISGANFGARPLVTLDLLPVTIQFSMDSQIVAAVPVNMMPPGKYLLTVSRGSSPAESASLQVALGSVQSARSTAAPPADAGDTSRLPAGSEVAAKVGDQVITVDDVDREWRRTDPAGYLGFSRQVYDTRRRMADQMVADRVIAREASARGLSVEALLEQEIPKRVVTTPESAVLAIYQGLGDRTRGASLEQMRPAIRSWLTRTTEPEIAKMSYVEELIKVSTRADVFLEAPRIQVERTARDPVLGPATAAVEIVAFGDFDSAEYTQFAQAFGRVRSTFGDRVHIVFKHLPLFGPGSVAISEAAACANAQGKFWVYHDAVIARTGPLDSARLKQLATEAGLNRGTFDACVDRDEFAPAMRDAVAEAQRYAIASSPSFLVNGRLAPAPPPFLPPAEFFKRLIEEELLRQSKAGQPNRP